MSCLDILTERMAEANIGIAVDCLKNLLKNSPKKLNINTSEYSSKLNQYTKFIHLRVWSDYVSVERVKEELIPLLEKAHEKIIFEGEYHEDLKTSIRWRIGNLKYRYCNGLESVIPNDLLKKLLVKTSLS